MVLFILFLMGDFCKAYAGLLIVHNKTVIAIFTDLKPFSLRSTGCRMWLEQTKCT